MTENSSNELTILFSDICRSTVLFDELGDEMALKVVMQAIELTSAVAEQTRMVSMKTLPVVHLSALLRSCLLALASCSACIN